MKILKRDERNALAQEMNWTLNRAQGYLDGEALRREGVDLPEVHRYDQEEYSKGFRAGYCAQECSLSLTNIRDMRSAREEFFQYL